MRFKSAKFWFVAGCLTSFSSLSFATVTVTPVSQSGVVLINNTDASGTLNAWYPGYPAKAVVGSVNSGDNRVPNILNLTAKQDSNWDPSPTPMPAPADATQAIYFNVTSSFTNFNTTTNGQVVVMVMASTSGAQFPVPIAYVNGALCSTSGNPTCFLQDASHQTYYYAASYTESSTVQIGIYPADICTALSSVLSTGQCSAATNTAVVASPSPAPVNSTGQATTITLNFWIVQLPTTAPYPGSLGTTSTQWVTSSLSPNITTCSPPTTQPTTPQNIFFDDCTATVVNFQSSGGTMASCPSVSGMYTPQDTSIVLNLSGFGVADDPEASNSNNYLLIWDSRGQIATSSFSTAAGANNVSPFPVPVTGSPNFGSFSLANSQASVGPFTNSTPATSYVYDFAFLTMDYAGFISRGTACTLNNVRTTQVQAFLNSSKCFIATAAYRSATAAPVVMLREFRDRILMKFGLGRSFVDWYYDWSPPAAEWLMDHENFRYPVLLALIPIEIFAWCCLHPLETGFFFFFVLAMLIGASGSADRRETPA